jgi:hypothetical protein
MSAPAIPAPAPTAPVPTLVPALALLEARRLLLHPIMAAAFALWLVVCADTLLGGVDVVGAFETVTGSLSFWPGLPAVVVGHMVATRDRRAGTLDLLSTVPGQAESRVRALCLAALAPALLGLALNIGLVGLLAAQDAFAVTPGVWHVVQAPVTILGACLLGIMIGVWAPSMFAPLLAMVALVAFNLRVSEDPELRLFGPAVFWADWGPFDGSVWVGLHPGSPSGHVLYLLGLCGLAATTALLRVTSRRGPVAVLAGLALALTVLGAMVQQP